MPKVIILHGLPASGKSTWARAQLAQNPKLLRVNRDDLRRMMYVRGPKWNRNREDVVIHTEIAAIGEALLNNFDVIVDDTNLVPATVERIERTASMILGVKVEHKHFDITVSEAAWRDRRRGPDRVGRAIIERMAIEHWPDAMVWTGLPLVIVDMDGTLANLDARLLYLRTKPKNYDAFYAPDNVRADKVNEVIASWVRSLYWSGRDMSREDSHEIVIVSGRPDFVARETEDWLDMYAIPYDHIIMRRGGDRRDDTIVKAEILDLIARSLMRTFGDATPHDAIKNHIAFSIDDRPTVVEMWRQNGITTFPVHQDRWAETAEAYGLVPHRPDDPEKEL